MLVPTKSNLKINIFFFMYTVNRFFFFFFWRYFLSNKLSVEIEIMNEGVRKDDDDHRFRRIFEINFIRTNSPQMIIVYLFNNFGLDSF